MTTNSLKRFRAINIFVSFILIVTMLQAIPVAFPNIFENLAKASDNATPACPSIDGTNGVLSGSNPIRCTYSNVPNNTNQSANTPIGAYVTATLSGGAGGGGGSDGGAPGQAGGAGANVTGTFTVTTSGLFFCIGNGGGGGVASASGNGGGSAGTNPCDSNENGGAGGAAGAFGSSGGGGGGGAATFIANSTGTRLVVAGGGGGGAGGSNVAADYGANTSGNSHGGGGSANRTGTTGGARSGTTQYVDDLPGGGGGGGGVIGGSGGAAFAGRSGTNPREGYAQGGNYGTSSPAAAPTAGGGGSAGSSQSGGTGATGSISFFYEGPTVARPTISSSSPVVGTALTATAGAVTTNNTGTVTTTWQWQIQTGCIGGLSSIAGATSASYTPSASDVGSCFSVRQTSYDSTGAALGVTTALLSTTNAVVNGTQASLSISASTTSAAYNGTSYSATPAFSTSGGTGSGAVTYAVESGGTAGTCTLSNSSASATLTGTQPGTCLISATKAAADGYNSTKTSTNLTFTFTKASQATITISASITSASYTGTAFSVTPSFSSSGGSGTGAVTYSVNSGGTASGCSLSSSAANAVLTATSAGTCFVIAGKDLDSNYNSAISANLVITFSATVPGAPSNLSAQAAQNQQVTLNWTAPTNTGGSAITDYKITYNYCTPTGPGSVTCNGIETEFVHTASASTSITVTGLTNGYIYYFTVYAKNAIGLGPGVGPSNGIRPSNVAGIPSGISATAGNTQATVTWTAPTSDGGADITDYSIQYSSNSGSTWSTFAHTASTSTSATVTGLTNGTSYVFRIAAVNASGTGTASSASSAVVPFSTLSKANSPSVAATSGSTTSLTVTFTPDASAVSTTLTLYSASTGGTVVATKTSATSPWTFTGLTANTTYWVTATSVGNGSGIITGAESDRVSGTTNAVAGQATFTLNSNVSGNTATSVYRTTGQSVTFSVTAASPDGGTLTYQWRKLVSSVYQDISGATSNTLTLSNLTTSDATSYFVRVTNSKNGSTADIASSTLNLNVAGTLSLATPSTGLTGNHSSTFTTLTLTASGGLRNSDTACAITTGALPSGLSIAQSGFNCQITGTPSATGSFAVVATITDSNGATASTNSFTIVISDVAPGQPTVNGWTTTSTSISVLFTAGTNTGSPITKYQYSTDDGTTWLDASGTTSPLVISSLTLYTTYNVKIRAYNSIAGTATGRSSITTSDIQPTAPTITGITPTSSSLSVAFTAGSNSGTAITKYQYSTDGGSTWADRTDSGTTASPLVITKLSSNTATSLSVNTSYSVKIRAYNSSSGIYSSAVSASTSNIVPGSPTSVSATLANASSVISWTAPSANGGSAITGYSVTSSPSVTAPASCTNTANTSCTFTGLTNGTSYTFSVVAINSFGSSIAGTATVTPATAPSAPQSFAATSNASGQSVLSWTAPSSTGGNAITGYTVTASYSGGSITATGCTSLTSTSTGCTLTGLTNGTAYTFTVAASNNAGTGSTATTTATPAGVPGQPTNVTSTNFDYAAKTILISWSAPSSNGGSAITDYVIEYGGSSSGPWTAFSHTASTSTSITVTGLSGIPSTYVFRVSAVNNAGTGTASTATTSMVLIKPATPSGYADNASKTSLTVTYTSLHPIQTNIYLYTSSSGGTPVASILGVITGSNQFTGLTAGTTYYAALTSSNTTYFTTSPESDRFAITTNASPQSATISTQPSSLTRTSGQSFQLSVAASVSDGGTLSYQWKRGTTNVGTGTTYSETNVQAGTYNYTVEITNTRNGLTTVATSNTATVTVSSGISITTPTTIYATKGATFAYTLQVTGGLAPYTFNFWNGTLPAGINLNTTTGVLSGTPTTVGTSTALAFGVTDSNYITGNQGNAIANSNYFNFVVDAAMTYSASATQSATVGTAYSVSFAVTGGRSTVSYSINSGSLPTGLSLNTTTGLISGTPSADGTFTATVRATDANSATQDLAVTFTVAKGSADTFTLGTPVRTVDGFTSQINVTAGYSYSVTATNSATVTIDSFNKVVVTGLAPNTSSSITVTSSRTGYTSATQSVTGTSLAVGLHPEFTSYARTSDGFTFTISNYDASYTWTISTSAGSISRTNGNVTVTGLSAGAAATAQVNTAKTGSTNSFNTQDGAALGSTTVSVALPSNATTATFGTAVTLTATATRAGTVTFKDTGTAICAGVTISASPWTATCSWTPGMVSTTRSITAEFTPTDSANYANSISSPVTVNVGKASLGTPTVTFAATPGSTTSITATITHATNSTGTSIAAYTASTGGTVSITAATTAYGTTTATFTLLSANTHYYFVFYAVGNGNYSDGAANSTRVDVLTNSTWTVTYNYNSATSGATPSSDTFVAGQAALNLPTPLRTNYSFGGWYSDSGFSTSVGTTTYTPTGSVTLYAKWTPVTYTVTYKAGTGATGTDIVQNFNVTAYPTLKSLSDVSSLFTRASYHITGWNTVDGGGGTAYAFGATSYATAQNLVLFAVWAIDTYSITTSTGSNGSITATATVNSGTSKTITFTPNTGYAVNSITVDGNSLSGTDLSSAISSGYTFTNVSANHTVSVTYSAVTYTVTYKHGANASGNDIVQSFTYPGSVTVKTTIEGYAAFPRPGYTFSGWTLTDGSSNIDNSGSGTYSAAASVIYYPVWTIKNYIIIYDYNTGTGSQANTLYKDGDSKTYVTAPGFTKTGYMVASWNTAANGSGTTIALGSTITTNQVDTFATYTVSGWVVNLYAQWVPGPAFTSIDVATSTIAGGQTRIITGTALDAVTSMKVDIYAATITAQTSTSITFTTPAISTSGQKSITLYFATGSTYQNNAIQYYLVPSISSISPTSGSSLGGTTVVINGNNFVDVSSVTIGGQAVTSMVTNSVTRLTVVSPVLSAGTYDVVVTNPGGSATLTSSFTSLIPQTITFTSTAPTNAVTNGASYTVTASGGGSGNAVTFSSTTVGVCTLTGSTFTFLTTGTCTVKADQAGNSTYSAAPQAAQSWTVGKGSVTLSNFADVTKTFGDSGITFTAPTKSASVAGSFSYTSSNTSVASVSGSTLNFSGAGTATITATFTPTDTSNYSSSTITMTATVSPRTIRFTANDQSKTYTGSTLSITNTYSMSTTLVGADGNSPPTLTYSYLGISGTTYTSSTTAPINVGSYSITPSGAVLAQGNVNNYIFEYVAGTLTVNGIAISKPNSPTVINTPGVLKSLDISWSAATGAASYTAKVYDSAGSTLIKTVTLLSGTNATISDTGLFTDDTAYTVTITAIAGTNYSDSPESTKSTATKTGKSYTISYNSNNATEGTVPSGFTYITGATAVTISSNSGSLARTGFTFAGWNTLANGSGTNFAAGTGTYNTAADATLYAKWTALVPTITSFTPTSPTYGSTVTITGTNFLGATSVKIGTVNVASFTVVSATSITFIDNDPFSSAKTITVVTPGGSVTSVATLSSQPQMPTITSQPQSVTKNVGDAVTFTVVVTAVSDGGTLSYQWKKGLTDISGATSATYSFTSTGVADAGDYSVLVYNKISTGTSYVTSNAATLTMTKGNQSALTITSTTGTYGTSLTLTSSGGTISGSVTYSTSTGGCTITSGALTTTGAVTCVVTATMAGNTDYNSVSSSATNVVIGKANQRALDFLCGSCGGTPSASAGFTGSYSAAQSTYASYQRYELSSTNIGSGTGAYTYSITSGTATNCQIGSGSTPSNIGSSYLQSSNSTNSIIWVLASTVGTCNLTLTRAADANYNSISVTALFTFNKANQSVTFSSKPTAITWGDTPAKVTATSTSGNTVSYRVGSTTICSLSGDTFTILQVGTCYYYTSALGNDNYSALSENYWSFTISAKALTLTATDQSINYGASVTKAFTITSGALAGSDAISGVTYTYAGISPTVYTSSTTVPTAPGSYTVTISSAVMSSGSLGNYAITYVAGTLTISKASQNSLSITSTSGTFGTSLNLTSTGGTTSGSVTYSTSTAGCSIPAGVLTSTGATTCVVTATMAGNTNYNDVSSTATNVVIAARPITLTVGNQSTAFTGSSVSINNSFTRTSGTTAGSDAISGMTYTYTSGGGYNSTTPPTIVGTYTITGSAAVFSTGTSANYDITYVTGTLTISASSQTITFTAPSNKTYGDLAFTVSPTASSSLTVVLASTTSLVCTVSSFTVTIVAPGTCTLTADQGGDSSFSAATQVSRSFTVAQAAQATLTISATTTSATSTGTAFTATPTFTTGSSGSGTGAVTYAVVTGGTATCTLSNSSSSATLSATTAGTCLIAATKASDTNYLSATSSNLTFTFSAATQSITFAAPSTTQFSAGSVSVSGTSTSGLTVAFSSGSTSVCTVSGTTVTFASVGSCVVNADQSGNTYYSAATQVQRTFTVSVGTQATLSASASITTAAYTGTAYTAIPSLSTGTTGSGTGAVTYAIATGGNATNCQLSSSAANATLTADSSGTCYIKATKASDSNYNSATSANFTFTFNKATLATPADPTVTQALYYSTQLEVTWSAVSNASSYTVSWYDSAGSTLINTAQVLSTVFSYSITPLASNTTYKVTVRANGTSNFVNSSESNMVSATTKVQPALPASFTVTYKVGTGNAITATGNTLISVTRGQSVVIEATVTSSDSGSTKVGGSQYQNGAYSAGSEIASPRTINYTIDSGFNTGAATGYTSCSPSTYTGTLLCLQPRNYLNGVGRNGSWIGLGFDIYAALSFTTPTRQTGTVGTAVTSFTPSVSGGKANYTYQRVLNLLPPGLTLDASTGAISGTPTVSGTYSPVIRVTEANGTSIDVTIDYTITALTQTISFSKPADKTYGDSAFTVTATSNSNLSVTFTSATTSVCTVSGTTVTIVTAGTCTLNANQAGDTAYSAATQVQQSFTVNKATQATVNIAAVTNSAAYTGSAYTATPTLSSTGGLGNGSVTYAVVSGGTAQGCSLTSGTITATSVGTCLIAATKAGDTNYLAGTSGNLTFTFTTTTQTITFTQPVDITYGATPSSLSATSSSGLSVAFTTATLSICTVAGSTLTILKSGTCTINANQIGDSNYSAATQVAKSFAIAKATPALSSLTNSTKNFGDSALTITDPTVTGSIPGTFTYTSASTSVATVSGAAVTPVAVGTSVITALFTPTDTEKYNTSSVTMTLTVAQRSLAQPNAPNATASAGVLKSFTVTWTAVTNAVAYALKIYAADGTTLLQTVSGLSGTSKTVTATDFSTIADNTGYKVGIVATGDSNNADSVVSALSSLITTNKSYVISYSGNNSTGGTTPASGAWITGATATTVASNSGTLARTGYSFAGWNSSPLGTGTDYVAGTGTYGTAADITLYAKWTAGAITITYNPDVSGGTNVTESKTADTAFGLRANTFTRAGFTFAGWATTSGGSVSKSDSATVTLLIDTTYYAVWTANKYTVTYNSNNATSGTVPTDSTEYLNAGSITVKDDTGALARTGYSFQGWADNSNGTGTLYLPSLAGKTYTVNLSNVTFYAVWEKVTYKVSYNVDGGSSVLPSTYQIGDSVTLPSGPTKAGHTFAGWFAESSGGSALSSSYSPSGTGNITIFARWTAIGYTVTYNGNGSDSGSVPTNSSTYTIGTSVPVGGNTGTLVKAGYTFAGWTVASDGTGTVLSASSTVTAGTSNITFYAKWSPVAYTVTYSTAGSTSGTAPTDSNNYNIGNTVSVSSNSGPLVKTGYTFAGWTTASDGTGTVYSAGNAFTVATANITFYSKWTANTYTVTFDANGASGSASKTSDTFTSGGTEVTLATVGTMAKTGYQFAGWATSANGTALSGTFATTSNATLYALWTAIPYTITYDPNGGTSTPTQGSLTMGQSFTLASGITKANGSNGEVYAFVGWSYNNSTYQPGYSITVGTSNITLTAVFIRVFTVKYSLNGSTDTPAADQLKNDGDRITTAAAPSRAGYVFAGWIDQSGQTFNAGVQYTVGLQHYLLYAQWSAINYQITYDAAGGSTTPIQAAKNYGQTFTVANVVSRTGYTFAGWSDGTTTFGAGATYLVGTSDITFTAQWTANVYTVSYDFNGGTGSAISNSSFTVGGTAITLPLVGDRVRTNYTFGGWSTSPTGTSLGTTYSPTASTTLYAVWTLIQYVVTYDRQDRVSATSNVTYNAGGSALTLPTPTRASYVFDGWYSASTGGTLVGLGGASFVPSSTRTLYAKWTQLSLSGLNPGDMTKITSGTAQSSITSTYTFNTTDSSVSVEVPAGSLPNNTALDFYLLATSATSSAKIPTSNGYILSLVIAWVAPDGTVPLTAPGKAISMTVTNTAIKKGASVYAIAGSSVQFLGVATQDGTVTVSITEDPEVVIVKTKPTAPRNVAGTATDGVGIVNWSAPLSDGGSPLLGYEVYLSGVATPCITTALTCTFTGLTNGTSYTVSVRAYNAIDYSEVGTGTGGTSFTSTSSTPPTPTPPTPTPPTPTQPTTPSTPPVAEPIYVAPAFETANFARSVVFADSKFELPGKSTTGSVLKWRTTSSACSVTTAGMITWNSTGLCSLIASVGAAEIAYPIQIDPRTEVTVQEITQVQSSNMTVNATVKWPGQAFDLRFCVGKSTNKCLFNKVISINSLEGQTLTADGDLYITTTIAGLSPRSEYDVFATVIATNKSLASNVRSVKTPAGIAAAVSGATTIILGQDLGLTVDVSGEGSVTSLRAVGLPAGVSIARTATGGTISGKPRATGVYFVTVKLTDSFRQITDLPVTIVVNQVGSVAAIVGGAIYKPTSAKTTLVSWKNIAAVKSIQVKLGASVVCTTTTTSCVVKQLLGPKSTLQIIATNSQGAVANPVLPIYVAPKKLVEVGTANFATNSTVLSTAQKNAFKKVAADMEAKGFTQLTVYGYSDQTGTKATNDKISLARATAIYDYLKVLLAEKQLTVTLIGKGFKDPVASNATAKGRAANRRAVISIG